MAINIIKFIKGILVANDTDSTKQLELSVGTASANTKTTIVAQQTLNRTITLPDQTGTLATDNDLALKADQDLSNLTPTSINESLVPDSDSTKSVGDPDFMWANGYFNSLRDTNDNLSISVSGRTLNTTTEDATVDYENKQLKTAGTIKLDWSATDVSLNTRKLTNVTDPSLAQDAATKNYVDTQDANKVTGPVSSVDGEIALFDATTGKLIKRATGTGPVKATSGVYSTGNINLASEVTGTLPIANGGTGQTSQTAAFDALAPTTTKGDIIVHNGTDNIRVAVGTDNLFLKANSAQASGVEWASANANLATATKTSAYTLTTSDDVILADASTASFTLSLPTAVGITGKVFRIKKTNSTNIVTIDANASETIDGLLTRKIGKQYDSLTISSDGANWQVLEDNIDLSCHYRITSSTANASIAAASIETVDADNKIFDYTNSVTTGASWQYLPGVPGVYSVAAFCGLDSVSDGKPFDIRVYKTGSLYCAMNRVQSGVAGDTAGPGGAALVHLNSTDYISISVFNGDSSARNVTTSATYGFISIHRVQ